MAFQSKTDYFGLAGNGLICISDSDGRTASVAEAKDEAGTIVANTVYGEISNPSNSYVVKSTVASTATPIVLGSVHSVDGKSYVLNSVSINTTAGGAPTVEASGEQVETSATATCTYSVPAYSLPVTHHAQTLLSAFALGSGDGCYLQAANYSCTATVTKATKDGDCLAHDVSEGKIEAQLTINQTRSTEPSLSAGNGWVITSPLACDNPDSDYPSWSCTLTKYLAKD